ncbi:MULTISPECIES: SDR family oxidoreductase [Pseudomonas]|uniref:SDR family oxidoreductase n=1 Tax=Pseudomonas TaxID=286 RepID=UPI001C0086D7|nr:SDR family oxidoreductase [Pseudomonas sp. TAE6080]MBT9302477.1 SDR family oxidoreductase [Pseudomonas sp. TAE6080]
MFSDLKNKVILVTGASSGIGRYCVRELCVEGAHVVAIGRNAEQLRTLQDETGCDIIAADLEQQEGLDKVDSALREVDGLVNCAGLALLDPATEMLGADFDRMMAINARATALMCQMVARRMIQQGRGGAIVNVSSQAALASLQDHLGYSASKAAMDAMTRVLCAELGPFAIRVNSVNPTVTLTPMSKVGWSDPIKAQGMLDRIPLGRFAEPEEVVRPILFLLSAASSMISGVVLPIDGGFTAG